MGSERKYEERSNSILLIVLLFTSVVLTTTNNVYGNDDKDELEKEIREKNQAGDHWLGGVTSDEYVDGDKESDLGYIALCE